MGDGCSLAGGGVRGVIEAAERHTEYLPIGLVAMAGLWMSGIVYPTSLGRVLVARVSMAFSKFSLSCLRSEILHRGARW